MTKALGLLAVVVAVFASTARAQFVSIYGTFSPTHSSNVQTGYVSGSEQYTSFWAPALGGGVTFNFLNLHVVTLGVDARGATKSGTTGADTAELSLRVGLKPPILNLRPYAQGGIGYLATRTNNVGANGQTFTNKYATLGFHAGVDTTVFPHIDLRLVELGYAHAYSTGLSSSANDANTFTLNTGVVVRF